MDGAVQDEVAVWTAEHLIITRTAHIEALTLAGAGYDVDNPPRARQVWKAENARLQAELVARGARSEDLEAARGLGRIAALHHRPSTSY